MKIAHVIKTLNPGGVETWLKDYVTYGGNDEIYFFLQSKENSFYESYVKDRGAKVCKINLKGLCRYSISLFSSLKKNKIDVIHSHVNLSSGWVLFIAFLAGVKIRVAQCHNDKRMEYKKHSLIRKLYYSFMKILVHFFANRKIAVSYECVGSMFYEHAHVNIVPCGLSFKKNSILSKEIFNFKDDDIVLCQVGRMVEQKNHEFIIQVLAALPNSYKLIIIGDGKLKSQLSELVSNLKLIDRVLFLGLRNDVFDIMTDVADILVMPSKFEGLGLVAIEAQVAGLFTVVSEQVPNKVKISDYIEFLSINSLSDINLWRDKIEFIISNDLHVKLNRKFDNSEFTIQNNIKSIESIYRGNNVRTISIS